MTTYAPPNADDELVIETPERVELYYTRAQVGNRFLAALVDHGIQLLVIIVLSLPLMLFNTWARDVWAALGDWAIAIAILTSFFILTSYFVVFETIWSGQTPGKRLFRLRVIRDDGRPIRFYEAMVRNLLRTGIDGMPAPVLIPLYSVGLVSVFLSSRSKRLGDYVAGTVVIREAERRAPTIEEIATLARDAGAAPATYAVQYPFTIDPHRVEAGQLRALRTFLRRRFELPFDVRADQALRIARSIAATCDIPQIPVPSEAILEEVDRQCRAARDPR